jgi:hypothetical protein
MNDVALHPTPGKRSVFLEEIRTIAASMRREFIVTAAVLIGVTLLVWIGITRTGLGLDTKAIRMLPSELGMALAWIGLVAPLAVWKQDGPSNRGYMWSLPVSRSGLTVARVTGGWIWLMVAIAALIIWAITMAWLSGGGPGVTESRLVPTGSANDATALRAIEWSTPAWQWAVPFVAATVLYLIGSAVSVLSDHPWRWLLASLLTLGLFAVVSQVLGDSSGGFVRDLLLGRFGLGVLVSGTNETATTLTAADGSVMRVWRNLADKQQWLTTVAIWGFPGLLGIFAAARRFHER